MGRAFDEITEPMQDFIARQHMFFVATAPLANDGRINVSPKGYDSFRLLDSRRVAYLDLTGSGAETMLTSERTDGSRSCSARSTANRTS